MDWPVFVLSLAIIFLGVRYLLRRGRRDQKRSQVITDPVWRRGKRLGDIALIVGTCGILLMFAFMSTYRSPLRGILLILGIVALVSAFVLSLIAGGIKGGSSVRESDVDGG
jgi:hypothetical protein